MMKGQEFIDKVNKCLSLYVYISTYIYAYICIVYIYLQFQTQRENPPPQHQQFDDQQLESLIKDYDVVKAVLDIKDLFRVRDEEYNYKLVRDIIINGFKRSGKWQYDNIENLIEEVLVAIYGSTGNSITPNTTTRVRPSGEYVNIGGARIVSSAIYQTGTIPTMTATITTPPENKTSECCENRYNFYLSGINVNIIYYFSS